MKRKNLLIKTGLTLLCTAGFASIAINNTNCVNADTKNVKTTIKLGKKGDENYQKITLDLKDLETAKSGFLLDSTVIEALSGEGFRGINDLKIKQKSNKCTCTLANSNKNKRKFEELRTKIAEQAYLQTKLDLNKIKILTISEFQQSENIFLDAWNQVALAKEAFEQAREHHEEQEKTDQIEAYANCAKANACLTTAQHSLLAFQKNSKIDYNGLIEDSLNKMFIPTIRAIMEYIDRLPKGDLKVTFEQIISENFRKISIPVLSNTTVAMKVQEAIEAIYVARKKEVKRAKKVKQPSIDEQQPTIEQAVSEEQSPVVEQSAPDLKKLKATAVRAYLQTKLDFYQIKKITNLDCFFSDAWKQVKLAREAWEQAKTYKEDPEKSDLIYSIYVYTKCAEACASSITAQYALSMLQKDGNVDNYQGLATEAYKAITKNIQIVKKYVDFLPQESDHKATFEQIYHDLNNILILMELDFLSDSELQSIAKTAEKVEPPTIKQAISAEEQLTPVPEEQPDQDEQQVTDEVEPEQAVPENQEDKTANEQSKVEVEPEQVVTAEEQPKTEEVEQTPVLEDQPANEQEQAVLGDQLQAMNQQQPQIVTEQPSQNKKEFRNKFTNLLKFWSNR